MKHFDLFSIWMNLREIDQIKECLNCPPAPRNGITVLLDYVAYDEKDYSFLHKNI